MRPMKKVDPDLFNPFTPLPYHNSKELKYAYAHVDMRKYIDEHTHINPENYIWKQYHDSYDHDNKRTHYWNR